MPEHHVLIHADTGDGTLDRVIGIAHRLTGLDPGTRVTVVITGETLLTLHEVEAHEPTDRVSIRACAAGLERNGIHADDLPAGIRTVPNGTQYEVTEQLAGAAYIRY
ncbi:Intracellular sulfur oxidation protein, DsrE/DsrF family [Arthrobacter sp. 31Cvi3.1E]|nr:Intracellular sulfur oxidation protein, DsrE/DsrF family [Arthrobacter sp. 31Cvi3.1E]